MWRRKYLMAGRKFDFKNRKIVIALVFRASSPIERFSQACRDPDSW